MEQGEEQLSTLDFISYSLRLSDADIHIWGFRTEK